MNATLKRHDHRRFEAETLDLTACDREPIHIPGAIQPHGVLLALDSGFRVRHVSLNTAQLIGVEPGDLLGRGIGEALGQPVLDAIRYGMSLTRDVPNPLRVPIDVHGEMYFFDGLLHTLDGTVVLELENPTRVSDGAFVAERLVDARQQVLQETLAGLTRCRTISDVAQTIADEVRSYTGFDRVMIYRFAPDAHGQVIAESRAEDADSYLGLHFPAGDIPVQARRLYAKNWLRLIADVDYAPSPIIADRDAAADGPLDLGKSVLRSVSPVHLRYLRNMGVGASMSISLMQGDQLWGLIACHHRAPRFVPYTVRGSCVLLGTVLSAQVGAIEQRLVAEDRARRRQHSGELLRLIAVHRGVSAGLAAEPEQLLQMFNAGGVAFSFGGEAGTLGRTPPTDLITALLETLDRTGQPDIFLTETLGELLPGASSHLATSCGLMAIRFASGDYLLLFRPELIRTVVWAGNPHDHAATDAEGPPDSLTPRNSFAAWSETVRGRSAAWSDVEEQMASELRSALSVHILSRAEELAQLNRQLALKNEEISQFLYTVSHDLKSPLITCRGFIGLLREDLADGRLDDLDDFARRVDDAAGRMGGLLDDLLEIYRLGRNVRAARWVDLPELVASVKTDHRIRFEQSGMTLRIADELPDAVFADEEALRRVLDNLLSNAIKYAGQSEDRRLTLGGETLTEETRLFLADHGPGIRAEHREKVFQLFQRFAPAEIDGSGLGLASVEKLVRLHGGRAWVEETPGGGATFWLAFPNSGR